MRKKIALHDSFSKILLYINKNLDDNAKGLQILTEYSYPFKAFILRALQYFLKVD